MNALVYWAGGAVLVAGLLLALSRLAGRKAFAAVLLAVAAGLALARQFALALPLVLAAISLWRDGQTPRRSRPSQGKVSSVTTGWFDMVLDHDTGEIDGRILQGDFTGRQLSDLDEDELRCLWGEIDAAGDTESRSLLEAYAARHRPGAEQEDPHPGGAPAGQGPEMTDEEAYRILGLEPGASREEVRAAYHRLIRKVHPDSGGTSALAALINAARQRLDPT